MRRRAFLGRVIGSTTQITMVKGSLSRRVQVRIINEDMDDGTSEMQACVDGRI